MSTPQQQQSQFPPQQPMQQQQWQQPQGQQPYYYQPQKPNSSNGCLKKILIVLGVLFVIAIITNIFNGNSTDSSKDKASADSTKAKVTSSDTIKLTWDYQEKLDEMTDSPNRYASIQSVNYIEQDFPYNGETYANIMVRSTKKYGTDVLISISQGQIVGHSYTGDDYITARFDENPPQKYYFNNASDGSSDVVFLKKSKDFIERSKSAKDIKIEIPLYQGGRQIFRFHVDESLKW